MAMLARDKQAWLQGIQLAHELQMTATQDHHHSRTIGTMPSRNTWTRISSRQFYRWWLQWGIFYYNYWSRWPKLKIITFVSILSTPKTMMAMVNSAGGTTKARAPELHGGAPAWRLWINPQQKECRLDPHRVLQCQRNTCICCWKHEN
jgi:hypothetical protein